MGRPAIYGSAAERSRAYRDRERVKRREEERVYREAQALELARLAEFRRQDSILLSMVHDLARKRFPRGLPNGFAPATEAQDLIDCALCHPEIVDKVLRACRVVDAETDLARGEARHQLRFAEE
jgi:hypothetical protein